MHVLMSYRLLPVEHAWLVQQHDPANSLMNIVEAELAMCGV